MIEKEKLKKAHSNWLKAQRFTLFGTLKFVDGESINEFIAKRRLAYFFNMLDRKVRNAKEVKRGNRLNRFVYLESGPSERWIGYIIFAFTLLVRIPGMFHLCDSSFR